MGMDFIAPHGTEMTNWTGWREIYGLAVEFGWEPAGTICPDGCDPENWEGDYFSNDGQLITDEDAAALAAALRRAIAANVLKSTASDRQEPSEKEAEVVPTFMAETVKKLKRSGAPAKTWRYLGLMPDGSEISSRDWLKEFAIYFEKGGCKIM